MTHVKPGCHLHPIYRIMQDYLFSVLVDFVDTESGEVISKTQFHKPLSLLQDEDINKYLHSLIRGIRQGRSVALEMIIAKDCDIPKVQEQYLF